MRFGSVRFAVLSVSWFLRFAVCGSWFSAVLYRLGDSLCCTNHPPFASTLTAAVRVFGSSRGLIPAPSPTTSLILRKLKGACRDSKQHQVPPKAAAKPQGYGYG